MNTHTAPGASASALGRWTTLAMAVASGIAVANVYYNQPMLAVIERDLPGPMTGFVPTATQLGYALGLFLLVPLGDIVERRRLIIVQFTVLSLALACVAVAPGVWLLLAASLVVGTSACAAQHILPFAAHLSQPEKRGATVGIVLSGILTGILLSRTLAGFVATQFGWRAMFWLAVPLALSAAALMAWRLPASQPDSRLRYGQLMASILGLWREFPALRLAALTQALLFGAFTAFWTILAFQLQEPRFGLGADVAGLFGVLGLVGILASPLAGRFTDRRGSAPVVIAAAVATLLAWLVFGLWVSLTGLVLGVILLDFGAQASMVANQHAAFSLRPEARSRLNTAYMGLTYLGGAAGSAGATLCWNAGGWPAVVGFGMILAATAALLQIVATRRRG